MMHFNNLVYRSLCVLFTRVEIKKEREKKKENIPMLFVSRYIEMFIKNRQQQGVNVLNRKEEISSKERSVVGDDVGPREIQCK